MSINTFGTKTTREEAKSSFLASCFGPTPAVQMACKLWACYAFLTEEYDLLVCTGPQGRDGILPQTDQERSLIGRNARHVLGAVEVLAANNGLTARDILDARNILYACGSPPDHYRKVAETSGLLPFLRSLLGKDSLTRP